MDRPQLGGPGCGRYLPDLRRRCGLADKQIAAQLSAATELPSLTVKQEKFQQLLRACVVEAVVSNA